MTASSDFFHASTPTLARIVCDVDRVYGALWNLRGDESQPRRFIGALSGERMRDRQRLFDQFATLFQFPHYFGDNWNAFVDCIEDLDWLRASGFVLVVFNALEVLEEGDPDELELWLEILSDAGASFASATTFRPALPFRVILHSTPEQAPLLVARLGTRDVPLTEA
jgi:Barstar (barnase inhibitor)